MEILFRGKVSGCSLQTYQGGIRLFCTLFTGHITEDGFFKVGEGRATSPGRVSLTGHGVYVGFVADEDGTYRVSASFAYEPTRIYALPGLEPNANMRFGIHEGSAWGWELDEE